VAIALLRYNGQPTASTARLAEAQKNVAPTRVISLSPTTQPARPTQTPRPVPQPNVFVASPTLPGLKQALQAPSSAPTSTPAQPSSPSPAPPTAQGAKTQTITGNETPYQVLPQASQQFQDILNRLQGDVVRQLDQPTVYDDALFKQVTAAQKAGINENFDAAQKQLQAELAARGINYSTIAGNKLSDLATARARALSDVDAQAARERALALAQGRSAASSAARGLADFLQQYETGNRQELRTERAYNDALRTQARDQALQELLTQNALETQSDEGFQDLLSRALGYGTYTAGLAGSLLGQGINAYSGLEGQNDADLSQLAELASLLLGRGGS
jgi:hypothetical protein